MLEDAAQDPLQKPKSLASNYVQPIPANQPNTLLQIYQTTYLFRENPKGEKMSPGLPDLVTWLLRVHGGQMQPVAAKNTQGLAFFHPGYPGFYPVYTPQKQVVL